MGFNAGNVDSGLNYVLFYSILGFGEVTCAYKCSFAVQFLKDSWHKKIHKRCYRLINIYECFCLHLSRLAEDAGYS